MAKEKGNIVKTYKFKVCPSEWQADMLRRTAEEYRQCYNRLSDAVCERLTSVRIGEMCTEADQTTAYARDSVSDANRDMPLYALFTKSFKGNPKSPYNIFLWYFLRQAKLCGDVSNALGFCETEFAIEGFIRLAFNNYRSKFSGMKTALRYEKADSDSDEETIGRQVMLEISRNGLSSEKAWEERIKWLSGQEGKESTLERTRLLYGRFSEKKGHYLKTLETLTAEALKSFGGCHMKEGSAVKFSKIKRKRIHPAERGTGYVLEIGKKSTVMLMGHRQLQGIRDGKPYEKTGFLDRKLCESISFSVTGKGEAYVMLQSEEPYAKTETPIRKTAGIDVNTKHAFLATSVPDDGNIKGYVNIYGILMRDGRFTATLSPKETEMYRKMSETVTFLPIEADALFSRFSLKGTLRKKGVCGLSEDEAHMPEASILYRREQAICSAIKEAAGKMDTGDPAKWYLCETLKARTKMLSYYTLTDTYRRLKSEYASASGTPEERAKASMEFSDTPAAMELAEKKKDVLSALKGLRNAIIAYAIAVLRDNGYDTIALENLESSQFENRQPFPTEKSMAKKCYGCSEEKAAELMKSNSDLYAITTDANGNVTDVTYSEKGIEMRNRCLFRNTAIKALGFASVKDAFIRLTNNNATKTVFVPPYYTSQMDSKKHVLYMEGDSPASKGKVRDRQETYIPNGLNADYNAACNIRHLAETPELSAIFCTKPSTEYGKPHMDAAVKTQNAMTDKLKKAGLTEKCNGK